jgi:trans-aconitate 2-methyltransferase
MSEWNATHYLKYGDERTRPAHDLAARIQLAAPQAIVDLGCGPGNSTQVLRSRWPDADISGVDSSNTMIEDARKTWPDHRWLLADVSEWTSSTPFDLVFSNAALQWIPNHQELMRHLLSLVARNGALAFQIPSSTYAAVRRNIHEISHDPAWTDRMIAPRSALTMEDPSFYYDALVPHTRQLDIWETEYNHIMDSREAIVDWISSTGLRPFLDVLNNDEKTQFVAELHDRVAKSYDVRADGRVLFPFRRLFVIAYKP